MEIDTSLTIAQSNARIRKAFEELFFQGRIVTLQNQKLTKCGACGARIFLSNPAYRNGQPVCEKCK